ncbi:hypothetical protein BH11MYX4_BH11MYX4_11010 [soil metagenome]
MNIPGNTSAERAWRVREDDPRGVARPTDHHDAALEAIYERLPSAPSAAANYAAMVAEIQPPDPQAVGGYRRDTWIYDQSSKSWASFAPGTTPPQLVVSKDGPSDDRFHGIYRPR